MVLGLAALAAPAATVSVNPASIAWNTNTWVSVDITGLSTGTAVDLSLLADINRNGAPDLTDVPLMRFRLQDGATNALGSRVVVCDTHGVADGEIRARISYFGVSEVAQLWRAVGQYIWRASYTNGVPIGSALFSVTQPASATWISGAVQVVTNLDVFAGYPLPGAVVGAEVYSDMRGVMPCAWSDTNGNFQLHLPAEVPADNVHRVWTVAFGYMMAENGPDGAGALSSLELPAVLSAGDNPLPQPLYVVPAVPGMVHTLSGRVYDEASNALPAVLVQVEPDEEDSDVFSLAMTDISGAFSVPMTGDVDAFAYCMDPVVNMRGLVGAGIGIGTFTSDVSGIALRLPKATTLVKGTVLKAEGPDGVPGALVQVTGNDVGSQGFSFESGGSFELCLVGGSNFEAVVSGDSLRPLRRVCPEEIAGDLVLPSSGTWTNLTIQAARGWVVSGHVYDRNANALPGGEVWALEPNIWNFVDEAHPNLNGAYELLLADGQYWTGTWNYADRGYLDQTWPDPVIVASSDVGGIDFYLSRGAVISGRVLAEGNPVPGANVQAGIVTTNEWGDWDWDHAAGAHADSEGYYALTVPPGTGYTVRAWGPGGSLWLEQWYSNVTDVLEATLVWPTESAPAVNINFNLQEGAEISGRVMGGGSPVQDAYVDAWTVVTNQSGGWSWGFYAGGTWTDSDGYYALFVRPDTGYVVRAQGPDGSPWLQQYYDNVTDPAHATFVKPLVGAPAINIDFDLTAGGSGDFAFSEARWLGNGQFRFTLTNTTPGATYTIECCTNWTDWSPLLITNCPYSFFTHTDVSATDARRFYRAMLGPSDRTSLSRR